MKKYTLLILLLIAVVVFSACSAGSGDTAKPLSEVFDTIRSKVELSEMNIFSDISVLERYYGITEDEAIDFAGGINNSGVEQEEIVLILAADNEAKDKITETLENRRSAKLNENINYNPAQAQIIERSKVEINGMYVSLIISENADDIEKIYHSELGI